MNWIGWTKLCQHKCSYVDKALIEVMRCNLERGSRLSVATCVRRLNRKNHNSCRDKQIICHRPWRIYLINFCHSLVKILKIVLSEWKSQCLREVAAAHVRLCGAIRWNWTAIILARKNARHNHQLAANAALLYFDKMTSRLKYMTFASRLHFNRVWVFAI